MTGVRMKKAMAFISMFCILNFLVLAGLLGFLVQSGRLDKSKVQTISDMLKHSGTPKDLRENVDEFWKPVSATQPATASTRPPNPHRQELTRICRPRPRSRLTTCKGKSRKTGCGWRMKRRMCSTGRNCSTPSSRNWCSSSKNWRRIGEKGVRGAGGGGQIRD